MILTRNNANMLGLGMEMERGEGGALEDKIARVFTESEMSKEGWNWCDMKEE